MSRRICNKKLPRTDYLRQRRRRELSDARDTARLLLAGWYAHGDREISDARDTARLLLAGWYVRGAHRADVLSPEIQIEENFRSLATMPKLIKNVKDGYVMICSKLDETPRPVVLKLDYGIHPTGGLTYRMIYDQVRSALQLLPAASLRLASWRPWFRFSNDTGGVPQRCLLPSTAWDADLPSRAWDARALLGTTLIFYPYISLSD